MNYAFEVSSARVRPTHQAVPQQAGCPPTNLLPAALEHLDRLPLNDLDRALLVPLRTALEVPLFDLPTQPSMMAPH